MYSLHNSCRFACLQYSSVLGKWIRNRLILSRRLHRNLLSGGGSFCSLSTLGSRCNSRLRLCGIRVGRRWQGRDIRVFELGAVLALEDRTAVREARGLVGFVGELALRIGLRQRAAVFYQLEQTARIVIGGHACGTAAERRQLPRLRWLDGRTLGRRKAHAGEICNA